MWTGEQLRASFAPLAGIEETQYGQDLPEDLENAFNAVGVTHVGNVRSINEDTIVVETDHEPYFALVADGMGGHAAGEVASSIAAQAICEYICALDSDILDGDALVDAIHFANERIMAEIVQHPEHDGMGTTVTLAYMQPESVTVAHVGDSSAFLCSGQRLHKITRDHTYVQKLIESGVLKRDSAGEFPYRNIITRALGMDDLRVDVYRERWKPGDSILLCSDGLTAYATQDRIQRVLSGSEDIASQANRLLDHALRKGGRDNISIVIVRNTGEGQA